MSQREGRKLFPPPAVVMNLVHGVQRAQVVRDVHVVHLVQYLRHVQQGRGVRKTAQPW